MKVVTLETFIPESREGVAMGKWNTDAAPDRIDAFAQIRRPRSLVRT